MASCSSKDDPVAQLCEIMSIMDINQIEVGSKLSVLVTHINHPGDFYVRPTNYAKYIQDVETYGDAWKYSEIWPGATVMYKSRILNKNVRGRLMSYTEDEQMLCDVLALDYGCTESVPLTELKKPNRDIAFMPAMALRCELVYCQPLPGKAHTWSQRCIDAMKSLVRTNEETCIITVRGKSFQRLAVELKDGPDEVGTTLVLLDYASLGYIGDDVNKFCVPSQTKHYYPFKKLNVNDVLHVRVLNGVLGGFYVAEVNDYKNYMREIKYFTALHKDLKCLEPKDMEVGKPIAALKLQESKYERAFIKQITSSETALVHLIDCGKIMNVDVTKMKPVTKELYLTTPATAIFCMAEENQVWDNGLHRFLYPGYEFLITIEEVGDKFNKPSKVKIVSLDRKK